MKPSICVFASVFFFVGVPLVEAQIVKAIPSKIGYVYPAGGQRGSTFEVVVGGRQISRTSDVAFSGSGISGRIVDTMRDHVNLDQRDRFMIRKRIGDAAQRFVSESPDGVRMKELIDKLPNVNKPADPPEEIEAVPFVWPQRVALRKLADPDATPSLHEMLEIIYLTYGPNVWRRPPDVINEVVILEVSIAPDAEPGDREIRLLTPQGLGNPLYFQVGIHPEQVEREPNATELHGVSKALSAFEQPTYELPVVLNGRITHCDVDRFRFRAKKGDPLVLHAQARRLMPYLADGVPGWFEAVLTVFDENERELAYADCYRFDADPVLVFDPPADGVYTVEIRDSLFRGREDFVYRLSIAKTPLVESVFPLGLREGSSTVLKLEGRNLPVKEITVDAAPGPDHIRLITSIGGQWLPRPVFYQVDTLPETVEVPETESPAKAQAVAIPVIVNGTISRPGRYDYYRFDGGEGETIVAEVTARRLNSPLDSRIALLDGSGKILAENDDGGTIDENRNYRSHLFGYQTHHADSKLAFTLPASGPYLIRIGDATRQGSDAHAYRLRLSKPRPDFEVYSTPSAVTLFAGNNDLLWFGVERKEEYQGPIEIRIVGESRGFRLDGGLIPAGAREIVCTLSTPREPLKCPIPLRFEAVAERDGQTIRRPVLFVDDMEQAFLYHHWMPADHCSILMNTRRGSTGFRPLQSETLRIKPGQSIDVEFESTASWIPTTTIFYLKNAPPGVWVRKKTQEGKKLTLTFGAAADVLQKVAELEYAATNPPPGDGEKEGKTKEEPRPVIPPKTSLAGNLITVVDAETIPKKPEEKKNRYSMGTLPAISFQIIP